MNKFELEDETPVVERLARQFQLFVGTLSTREITSNDNLVRAIENLENVLKQSQLRVRK